MKAIVQLASVEDTTGTGIRYNPAIFSVNGIVFTSETPTNAGDATTINNTMDSLTHFQVLPPPLKYRGLFQ